MYSTHISIFISTVFCYCCIFGKKPPPRPRLCTPKHCNSSVPEDKIWNTVYSRDSRNSNGKSSIVEERLYSFFFVFFQQKNEASLFRFSSLTQLGTKTFVLLRSGKIFKRFTSLCFVFTNFWNNPFRFTFDFEKVGLIPFAHFVLPKFWNNLVDFSSIFRSLGTSSSFCFRSYYTSD